MRCIGLKCLPALLLLLITRISLKTKISNLICSQKNQQLKFDVMKTKLFIYAHMRNFLLWLFFNKQYYRKCTCHKSVLFYLNRLLHLLLKLRFVGLQFSFEQAKLTNTFLFCFSSSGDDVQRSIELLDRVLSEFDDVENANQVQNVSIVDPFAFLFNHETRLE